MFICYSSKIEIASVNESHVISCFQFLEVFKPVQRNLPSEVFSLVCVRHSLAGHDVRDTCKDIKTLRRHQLHIAHKKGRWIAMRSWSLGAKVYQQPCGQCTHNQGSTWILSILTTSFCHVGQAIRLQQQFFNATRMSWIRGLSGTNDATRPKSVK